MLYVSGQSSSYDVTVHRIADIGPRDLDPEGSNCWWGGWGSNPRPADYEKYGLTLWMARSTNRSTPHHGDHRMPATERYRRPADQRVRVPDGIRPAAESKTLLAAEPLDLHYEHEIVRRVHQERNQAPPSGPKCSERSGIETSSRSSRRR